eukprot:6297451-Pyramimonas_sp.AAC.1
MFAGSSLARVGGVAPCRVAFGRQPSMLPLVEMGEESEVSSACGNGAGPSAGGEVQPSRLLWRVRGIVLQRAVEATLISRVSRALWARAAEPRDGRFNVGDQVEIRRLPSTEDMSGWAIPGA